MRQIWLGPTIGLVLLLMTGCQTVSLRRLHPSQEAWVGNRDAIPTYETPPFARDPLLGGEVHAMAMAEIRDRVPPDRFNFYTHVLRPPLLYTSLVAWDAFVVGTAAAIVGGAVWVELGTCCCAGGRLIEAGAIMGSAVIEAGLLDVQDMEDFLP